MMLKLIRAFSSLFGGSDGIECGDGWISRDKKCRKGESAAVSENLDSITDAIKAVSALSLSPSIEELNKYFEDGEVQPQNEGIFKTKAGAMGIQSYFGADYPQINQYFYDEEYRNGDDVTEDIKMKANAAVVGFEELPKHSYEEIKAHYAERGVEYDGKTLFRGMSFSSQEGLDDFVKMHEIEAKTVTYEAFTSTSLANPNASKERKVDGGWGGKALQIEIEHKGENSTGAKWVDERKKSKNEGEMLYPPHTKFSVVKIEKEERERLPERLREPLQSVWKSSEEGGGASNLQTSALLGEKSPQAILEDESFAYFRNFLKKRGLPPVDEWPNLPLSKIFKVNDMRGGRFAIMNELVKALSDQVKEEEKTNQKELSGAKIYLKEL